ncbi:hypothetical protein DSLASN_09310 [Desulfoluna limicola]|uniref:YCII-related domain-containing protein n=1 Tax=Desulfoluna limicola TaxID=2810562 RepID=A0ABM7PDS3_9BACT|nr:YciI family protein [Desulfoluna limicola]BCS95299.1 hypothetical protein DSLASN_09310 [Desulfoluna limicola]
MLFVIRFTDTPNSLMLREQHLEAHISWLDERRDTIRVAGSLREEPGSAPTGALWVVEADSKREVSKLYTSDPFWTNGLREGVEIYHWSKAFPDEQTPV